MKIIFRCFSVLIVLAGCETGVNENKVYDYSIEQQMNCSCPQAGVWVKLYVKADTVADAIRISDNYQLKKEERTPYKSIKVLFDLIAELDTAACMVTIRIDSVNNYPTYIYSNTKPVVKGDTVMIITDAQWSYLTRNYIRLK